ncbi:MAG: hypothetical protein LBH39_01575 [Clostridiales Family XIII bacterium]|jgi:hypothetical protein|nr:hypothetical protein [Clostridiales Family XIII bacterium]
MVEYIEQGAGGRLAVMEAGRHILPFEEKIITSGKCPALLPCVVFDNMGRRALHYGAAGYTPLGEFCVGSLDQALGLLYMIPQTVGEAEDWLLSAEKLSLAADGVYIGATSPGPGAGAIIREVRLIYGFPGRKPFRTQYAELLETMASWGHIPGLGAASRQIGERIQIENPGMRALLRIVEAARREWNLIQPEPAREAPAIHGPKA